MHLFRDALKSKKQDDASGIRWRAFSIRACSGWMLLTLNVVMALMMVFYFCASTPSYAPPRALRPQEPAALDWCTGDCLSSIIYPASIASHEEFVTEFVKRLQKRVLNRTALGVGLAMMTPQSVAANKLWMEFGVFEGSSAKKTRDRLRQLLVDDAKLYAFDSFQGLPEVWNKGYRGYAGYEKGSFRHTEFPFDDASVVWVKGWFNESLPKFYMENAHLQDHRITYMHLDADLYSSTATVLHQLARKIEVGCVMVFDDIVNFPDYRNGELKALWEFLLRTQRPLEVIGATGPRVELFPNPSPFKSPGSESVVIRVW